MGFERLKLIKELAKRYYNPDISTNELALKCRESSPMDWIKVRNISK